MSERRLNVGDVTGPRWAGGATNPTEPFYVDGYVPPLPIGTRVIATAAAELAEPGTLGTITWHHPAPSMPYRVKWEMSDEEHGAHFGMSDIGDLTRPDEIEQITETEVEP